MAEMIIQPPPSGGALSAEHYQTFEMAKEHDSVLGGDSIAAIRSYSAYARAQAQAIHKTIAATSGIEDVAAIKAEALETEQTFARVSIYADQRIGELLRELPKATNQHDAQQVVGMPTSTRQAEREAGLDHHTSVDLQTLAANPEVVQAVLDKAQAEGRVPSRRQVLDAIRERDAAKAELEALRAEPPTVERTVEVTPDDYDAIRHERNVYLSDLQRLRKSNEELRRALERAEGMLGMNETMKDVRKDVQYLTAATNQYIRQYGGLTWTAASFEQVDADALAELRKAAINLATFANALVASLEAFNG